MFSLQDLLLQSLFVAGVSIVMALLISLVDGLVNNYGPVVVAINAKRELKVNGGGKLLGTLADQGIFLPSACGGRGSCGACKCKIDSDVGPHLPTEIPYLNAAELADNIHLACQVKVKSNISIQIPEALFNIKKLTGTVVSIVDLTHDIKEVRVKLADGASVDFEAGQYGQFEVPPYGEIRESTQRAYSFSSHPQDKGFLEFLIRLVPGGIVTSYVHQQLKQNQSVNIVAPVGDFHIRDSGAVMICVAGGSGMAPFKSIFNDMIQTGKIKQRDIWYFFGARTSADMYYLDWLRGLEKQYPRFHFVPALSEPQAGEVWDGPVGLITNVLSGYLEKQIGTDQEREGYLCGSPGMLDACMNVMRKHHMKDSNIYFDKFA